MSHWNKFYVGLGVIAVLICLNHLFLTLSPTYPF